MSNRGAYYKNRYGGRRGSRGGWRGGYQNQNSYGQERLESASYDGRGSSFGGSRNWEDLARILANLEGKSYKAYHDISGCWIFPNFKLFADKIQSDPFAPASLFRVVMDQDTAGYPAFTNSARLQQIATGDYLTRIFSNLVRFGGHDRQLSGGGEGWHGKKGGSMNIETFVMVQLWNVPLGWVVYNTVKLTQDQKSA